MTDTAKAAYTFTGKAGRSRKGRYNADGSAAEGISGADITSGIDSVMGAVGTFGPMVKSMNMGTSARQDEKGNVTHKVNTGANVMAGTAAGAKIGENFGPWGAAIGGAVGGIGAGIVSIFDKANQPTAEDTMRTKNRFEMDLSMNQISANDTQPQQAQAAEDGIDGVNGTKQIEVEKDEIVLRKVGKAFKKVADFKGGKSHSQGGEPYVASEGDIIIPGKKRLLVDKALRTRDWRKVESIRQTLPADPVDGMAAEGVKTVKSGSPKFTAKSNMFGSKLLDTQNLLYNKFRARGYSDTAAKAMVINYTHESDYFTAQEEYSDNKNGTRGAGMAQWTDGGGTNRREYYQDWMKRKGYSESNPEHQAEFAVEEIDNFKWNFLL